MRPRTVATTHISTEASASTAADHAVPGTSVIEDEQSEEAATQVLGKIKSFGYSADSSGDYQEYNHRLALLKADLNQTLRPRRSDIKQASLLLEIVKFVLEAV
jgi:hypothetical protein